MGNNTSKDSSANPSPAASRVVRSPPSTLSSATHTSHITTFNSSDTTPIHKPGRRRSIELGDIDTSLTFTNASSSGSEAPKTARPLSGGRKQPTRVADIGGDDEVEVGGTLRGAMLGKADHVVYGPRRIDGIAPGAVVPASQAPSPASSSPHTSRPASIAIPPTLSSVIDSDDTTSPQQRGSSRLNSTSQVISAADNNMPTIVSPKVPSPLGSTGFLGVISSGLSSPTATPTPDSADLGFLTPKSTPALSPDRSSSSEKLLPPTSAIDVLSPLPSHEASSSALSITSSPTTSIHSHGESSSSGSHLLPPTLLNAPVAAVPIPLGSVPSATIAAAIRAAAVDLGAGAAGVPTLVKWQREDGQVEAKDGQLATGPAQVFVTGTFAKGWKTKIELKKNNPSDFSVLILLPPGPHRLKFIVDQEWKASRHLPAATDADGNLINYLQVKETAKTSPWSEWTSGSPARSTIPLGTSPAAHSTWTVESVDNGDDGWGAAEDTEWSSEIPRELLEWGEWEAEREAAEIAAEFATPSAPAPPPPPPPSGTNGVPPPSLPAQLEKGPLNHAAYVTQGSGDDNSILPKPDHSVINHLAASPIKGGFLSVGVTTRYKRKFVTVVYYKALNT